ncbi:MAG: M23 family metallopeptidase [Marinagarivorans sp.]
MSSICKLFIAVVSLIAAKGNCEIYKYQDANGKWQYTDKKPKDTTPEVVEYKTHETKEIKPEFRLERGANGNSVYVKNPFYAPMQIEIKSNQLESGRQDWLIPALGMARLFARKEAIEPYEYRWQLGDPKAVPRNQYYRYPIKSGACVQISQGFNGRYSHTDESSRYAVDIATNVGTSVVAARSGVVVQVKDDYPMGGVNEYFLDKANFVSIIHEDGSLATYAHILLGSAEVKPGDRVQIGQELAKSGSSGFSSGPHVHFAIMRNAGNRQISIPFEFIDANGARIAPVRGLKMCE